MKSFMWLLAGLTLSCTLMAVPSVPQGTPRSQLQNMVDQLNVTADQKAKLDPILEEDNRQVRALRGDNSPNAEVRKGEIRKATDAKIKPILTAEQWTKLQELRDERKKQGKKKQ